MLKKKWPILQIDRIHKRLGGHTRAWAQHAQNTHTHIHTRTHTHTQSHSHTHTRAHSNT